MTVGPVPFGRRFLVWVVALVSVLQVLLEGFVALFHRQWIDLGTYAVGSILIFAAALFAEKLKVLVGE